MRKGRTVRFAASGLLLLVVLAVLPTNVQAIALLQSTFSTSPATSLPNTMGSLQVSLKNTGTVSLFDVLVTIDHVEGGISFNNTKIDVGTISPNGTASVQLPFYVPAETQPGFYAAYVKLQARAIDDDVFNTVYTTIGVRSQGTAVVRSITPDRAQPGEEVSAALVVANTGPATLSNLQLTWSAPANAILPLGGSNLVQLPLLGPFGEQVVPIRFRSNPTAAPGLYPLTFVLGYNDNSGTPYTATSTVGVILGGATAFDINVEGYEDGELTLAVVNAGVTPATAVQARILPTDLLTVDGSDTAVLGKVLAGNYSLATYDVSSHRDSEEPFMVEVSYTDSLGQRRTENVPVQWNEEKDAAGTVGVGLWAGALGVLAGLGAGIVVGLKVAHRPKKAQEAAPVIDAYADILAEIGSNASPAAAPANASEPASAAKPSARPKKTHH